MADQIPRYHDNNSPGVTNQVNTFNQNNSPGVSNHMLNMDANSSPGVANQAERLDDNGNLSVLRTGMYCLPFLSLRYVGYLKMNCTFFF
jgi:hypothetical protein